MKPSLSPKQFKTALSEVLGISNGIVEQAEILQKNTAYDIPSLVSLTFELQKMSRHFVSDVNNNTVWWNTSGTISEGGQRKIWADHDLSVMIRNIDDRIVLLHKIEIEKKPKKVKEQIDIGAIGLYYNYVGITVTRESAKKLITEWKPHKSSEKLYQSFCFYNDKKNVIGTYTLSTPKYSSTKTKNFFEQIFPLLSNDEEALSKAKADYALLNNELLRIL